MQVFGIKLFLTQQDGVEQENVISWSGRYVTFAPEQQHFLNKVISIQDTNIKYDHQEGVETGIYWFIWTQTVLKKD